MINLITINMCEMAETDTVHRSAFGFVVRISKFNSSFKSKSFPPDTGNATEGGSVA